MRPKCLRLEFEETLVSNEFRGLTHCSGHFCVVGVLSIGALQCVP